MLLQLLLLSLALCLLLVLVHGDILLNVINLDWVIDYVADVLLHSLLHFLDDAGDVLRVSATAGLILGTPEEAGELTLCRGTEARDHGCTALENDLVRLLGGYQVLSCPTLPVRFGAHPNQIVHNEYINQSIS